MSRKKIWRFEEIKEFSNVFEGKVFLKKIAEGAEIADESLREKFSSSEVQEKWHDFVSGGAELILELGCGKGDFAVRMGEMFAEKLVVGVDRKGERIWCGARAALEKGLKNVVFLRCSIENLEDFFEPQSVGQIWITFPDPFPGSRRAHRRLTSGEFLQMYRRILRAGGRIFLKTDSRELLEYSAETLEAEGFEVQARVDDLYGGKDSGRIDLATIDFGKLDGNFHCQGGVVPCDDAVNRRFFEENPEVFQALQIQTAFERRHLAAGRKIGFLAAGVK